MRCDGPNDDGIVHEKGNNQGMASIEKKEERYVPLQVNSIRDMVEFIDILDDEKLIIEHKDVFEEEFNKIVVWFYNVYLEFGFEKEVPHVIDGYVIDLLHFYVIVQYMRGFKKLNEENKWQEVVEKLGFPKCFGVKLKICYMKYLDLTHCYYMTLKEGVSQKEKEVVKENDDAKRNGSKWKTRVVSARRYYPPLCGPSNCFAGTSNNFDDHESSKELSIEGYEDDEAEESMNEDDA
ncbi:hypothetical protein L1987_07092 [Smallanthus sonchifolius]|uniref:Uncharacterized protein n=1 Tax=Smallanthus sonchifolius TaxID=185202 RepID=A0ACB9JZY2_9ASTR|nr:hypothetical protein L1987_07092 [Smallanthus sonchifolius]